MNFFSTRDVRHQSPVSLSQAVLNGLAPDGGLYMPEHIPLLTANQIKALTHQTLPGVAFTILQPFLSSSLHDDALRAMCDDVFNFPVPLIEVEHDTCSLELFHGPTLAFKDVGARFMARLLAQLRPDERNVDVVVATSGDTGSAVAAGFHRVAGIRVFVLFPKNKVSHMQQLQLTTWGDNIHAVEVDGTFDDCQRMVKQLLADQTIQKDALLTSANSINVARLLPQAVYYAWACSRPETGKPVVISVPSGNFGNLTAGLLARRMGIGPDFFVAATNANTVVPDYLQTGRFEARPSVSTLSNAMDVGNPSNFERMLHVFEGQHQAMQEVVKGYSFSDSQTREAIANLYHQSGYTCDPHGAVGWLGLHQFRNEVKFEGKGIFLETAHPAKFVETVEGCTGNKVAVPERLAAFANKKETMVCVPNNYEAIREVLRR